MAQEVSLVQMMKYTNVYKDELPDLRILGFKPPVYRRKKYGANFDFESYLSEELDKNNPFADPNEDYSQPPNPYIKTLSFILTDNEPLYISMQAKNWLYWDLLQNEADSLGLKKTWTGWDSRNSDRKYFGTLLYMFDDSEAVFETYHVKVKPKD
jgi:hypothetical protein